MKPDSTKFYKTIIQIVTKSLFAALLIPLTFISTVYAEVTHVDSHQLQALANQNANIIDIRRLDEWDRTGVIENSIPLTFFDNTGEFDGETWLTELREVINENLPIVLICHSGARSKWVANWLDENAEFENIYNVRRGIKDWIGQGNPVVNR